VWSFGKRHRPLLGLDITTSSVKLIELTMSGGQYRVESYAAEPTPHNAINEKAIVDAEAVGEAIRRAVKRSGARSRLAAIAIRRCSTCCWSRRAPRMSSSARLR
jgi:type IV pilus assembly protein PilM